MSHGGVHTEGMEEHIPSKQTVTECNLPEFFMPTTRGTFAIGSKIPFLIDKFCASYIKQNYSI